MDPEQPQPKQQQQLQSSKIIQMMRVTKKTDPLFKPLKKLKNALETIGYDRISLGTTKCVIIFHFGLGNDIDLQFIKETRPPQYTININPIIPGRAYCYLNFHEQKQADQYIKNQYKPILEGIPAFYVEKQYGKMSRVLICMFSKEEKLHGAEDVVDLEDVPFHYEAGTIPGMILVEDFITKEQQLQLLESIDKAQWSKLNNRRVQHYGYEFKYGRNQIDRDQKFERPMPEFIQPILNRLQKLEFLPGYRYDQMTINDYFSGDGIPAHFDTHSPFEEYFVAISMLSGLVMDWRKYDGTQRGIYLSPRSLIVFAGEGRYAWTHAIACRKFDQVQGQLKHRSRRISITLRKIKFTPCVCPYYFYCDSQGYDQSTMKKNNPLLLKYLAETENNKKIKDKSPQAIYKTYVIDAYNGFGFDFHNKSIRIVQKLIENYFLQNSNNQQLLTILDIGCGNGQYKDLLLRNHPTAFYHYIGIQICQQMKPFDEKVHMDGRALCFRPTSFDLVLCVAVLHHLTTLEQRVKMMKEMARVCREKEKGKIIITVFGWEQKKEVYGQQDVLLDYCVPVSKDRNIDHKKKQGQIRVQKRGKVYQRYYHLFQQQQLVQLCKQACLEILSLETDKQNIVILCQPISIHT